MKTLKLLFAFFTLFVITIWSQPVTVPVLSYSVMNVAATSNTLSPLMPNAVNITFQPYFMATANGQTIPINFGNSIDVTWLTADTTSISMADMFGVPFYVQRTQVAAEVALIAQQQLVAQLTPTTPTTSTLTSTVVLATPPTITSASSSTGNVTTIVTTITTNPLVITTVSTSAAASTTTTSTTSKVITVTTLTSATTSTPSGP